MSLEINYIDAPGGAQDNVAVTASGMTGDKMSGWITDGTSGPYGIFLTVPSLTLEFSAPYTATGLTFQFGPVWCSSLRVAWYLSQSLLFSKTYTPDASRWVLEESVDSFDKIVIEFLSTSSPSNALDVQKITIGRIVRFGADELSSVRLVNESDHSLCGLSADTMTVVLFDRKNHDLLPQENQRMELYKDGKLKAVQYIKTSTRESRDKYTIVCRSVIGLLEDEFLGGIYVEKPLVELLAEMLGDWPFEVSSFFSGTTITGYLPVSNQRSALQQVAFAIGAMVTTHGTEKIILTTIPAAITARFQNSDIFLGGSVKTSPRIARVELSAHSYIKADVEETLIREEELVGEDMLLTFSAPHHSYTIEGGTITDYGDNWVKVTAAGIVTLKAKIYTHNVVTRTRHNPAATAKERGNYVSVNSATLINPQNVETALERLYSANRLQQTVMQEVIVTGQKAGDRVSSLTPWGTVTKGFITSMDSVLTQNGHVATILLHGTETTMGGVYYYSGELWSGDMEMPY